MHEQGEGKADSPLSREPNVGCFHGEGQGERACPHTQALVTEPCLITFSFIQQVFIEDLPRAEYSAGPWRHRGELDRRGLPSRELADVSLQRFLAVGS